MSFENKNSLKEILFLLPIKLESIIEAQNLNLSSIKTNGWKFPLGEIKLVDTFQNTGHAF